ncbi:MAG: diacylglycerol kinase family lipid kinase [Bacillota bacterium]|nr:diacylglycerol kinase family lipid kinase [Bacillota bacterium]
MNPVAGNGLAARAWPQIRDALEGSGTAFETLWTEKPKDGVAKAKAALEMGATRVVSVGGDGTIHEVVNVLFGRGVEFGIVPLGRGNDFARTVGIPADPVEAARAAIEGAASPIDLGQANGEVFINVAGLGFDAEVAAEANRIGMFINGTITYFASVFTMLHKYSCQDVTITIDGKTWDQRILLLAVGNGKYYGGGMKITPDAVVDDGLLDIVVAGDMTRLETVLTLPKVYSGAHVHHPKASTYRGKEVTVTSKNTLSVHAEGEIISSTPVTFKVLAGALRLVRKPAASR